MMAINTKTSRDIEDPHRENLGDIEVKIHQNIKIMERIEEKLKDKDIPHFYTRYAWWTQKIP